MKRFQIIYPLVGLACWLGTLFLAGCSDDTGSLPDQTTEAERIPVTISIGVDEEVAKKDACRMEHVISDESFEKIKQLPR